MDDLCSSATPVDGIGRPGPSFGFATFDADDVASDRALSTGGWGKGVAWINGFCLGWAGSGAADPRTLFVPAPVLRAKNTLAVLELLAGPPAIEFVPDLVLGPRES